MAHARRKYFEAQSSDIMRSMVMLAYIHLLYDVEREAREGRTGRAGSARRYARSGPGRSWPTSRRIWNGSGRRCCRRVPSAKPSPTRYRTGTRWCATAEDGDLEIDNNGAERSLRGVAVGRRNWTFFGSDNGGRTAAVLTSLIATCKRHHIDPFAYLRDVFAADQRPPQESARGTAARQMAGRPGDGYCLIPFRPGTALT